MTVCKAAESDVKAVEAWAQIFKSKTALVADITKRYALHRKAIKADEATLKADWAAGEYYQAGSVAADLATLAVGPVVVPAPVTLSAVENFPLEAIPDFTAGFIYGMTGDNDLAEIEACF